MDPEVKETKAQDIMVESSEASEQASPEAAKEQWQEVVDQISEFLAKLPDYLSDFFGQYKQPIVTVGLIVAAIIAVRLTFAVLGALNDIPLISPLLELVGLGYSVWFVYRYLLKASTRQELSRDFNTLKEQVIGRASSMMED